jgi:signal transduction histidine kinase/CheY-like chemotaxis protein
MSAKHPDIQMRIFVTLMMIACTIILAGIGSGIWFINRTMDASVRYDLGMLIDVADRMASNEIELLEIDAEKVAEWLVGDSGESMRENMLTRLHTNRSGFLALGVIDDSGLVEHVGEYQAMPDQVDAALAANALAGQSGLSSIIIENDGTMTYRIMVPIEGRRYLVSTVPGNTFNDLFTGFKVWSSGDIFLADGDGVVVAGSNEEWVASRRNIFNDARAQPGSSTPAEVVAAGAAGLGQTVVELDGRQMICVIRPLDDKITGWSVGLLAPVEESPVATANMGILLIAVISLVLAAVASGIGTHILVKPYKIAERAKADAEIANEAKSAFLANMSHEMRTPLNAVIGLTEISLTGDDPMSDEVRGNMEKIYTSAHTLLGLINDTLDLSKIESGKLEFIYAPYDVPSTINDTVAQNVMRIGSKDIEFRLHVDPNLPQKLTGDELRVKQIFSNILSNAFKYTKSGIVEWHVRHELDEEGTSWLVCAFRDTGQGIKEEDMDKLFGKYNRLSIKANRKIEGTGLGLALTKRMVDEMGGQMSVQSTFGVGSTFSVRLRQSDPSEGVIGPEVAQRLAKMEYTEHKSTRGSLMKRHAMPYARVMVVDDVHANLIVAQGMLKPYGMTVDSMSNGFDAIKAIELGEPHYDAIFMDHMMPEMDGIEAAEKIHALPGEYARNMPIIALTANVLAGNEELFKAAGFCAFLGKPIDIYALNDVVNHFVRDKSKERASGIDIKEALERFSGDTEVLAEVLESYIVDTPPLLEELETLLAAGDMPAYGITVHGIKGASRAISAKAAGDAAEELEHAAKGGDEGFVQAHHAALVGDINNLIRELQELGYGDERPDEQ